MKKKPQELLKAIKEQATFRLAPNAPETLRKGEFVVSDTPQMFEGVKPELLQKADDILIVSTLLGRHPTETKIWNRYQTHVSELRKAQTDNLKKAGMDSTSGKGAEWIPTELSSELIRMIEDC